MLRNAPCTLLAICGKLQEVTKCYMVNQLSNRTVITSGQTIQRLRIEKGWRVEDLAKKAKCSLKTVKNLERGKRAYLFTISKLAAALGVEVSAIIENKVAAEPTSEEIVEEPKKDRRFKLQITLDIPHEEFDECWDLTHVTIVLSRILKSMEQLIVTNVESGSTVITLEMTLEDIQKLIKVLNDPIFGKHELDQLRVHQVQFPDSEDFNLNGPVEGVPEGEPLRGRTITRDLVLKQPGRGTPPKPKPKPLSEKPVDTDSE